MEPIPHMRFGDPRGGLGTLRPEARVQPYLGFFGVPEVGVRADSNTLRWEDAFLMAGSEFSSSRFDRRSADGVLLLAAYVRFT